MSDNMALLLSAVVIAGNDTASTPYANIGRMSPIPMVFGMYPCDWANARGDAQPELFWSTYSSKSWGVLIILLAKVLRQ